MFEALFSEWQSLATVCLGLGTIFYSLIWQGQTYSIQKKVWLEFKENKDFISLAQLTFLLFPTAAPLLGLIAYRHIPASDLVRFWVSVVLVIFLSVICGLMIQSPASEKIGRNYLKAILCSFFFVLLGSIAAYYKLDHECVDASRVGAIGGCDTFGNCGVISEDGRKSTKNKPVVGEEICFKERAVFKK